MERHFNIYPVKFKHNKLFPEDTFYLTESIGFTSIDEVGKPLHDTIRKDCSGLILEVKGVTVEPTELDIIMCSLLDSIIVL